MRILILERNLIWSSRLANAARGLGYEAQVASELPQPINADIAIINLAEPDPEAIAALTAAEVKIIAHAGHKEKARLEMGKVAGCDLVVTNSELTFKLGEVIKRLASQEQGTR